MARKRVSPEAQIIALFTGLSPESKRMVMFGLNAIVGMEPPAPKPTPSVVHPVRRTSPRKISDPPSAPNSATDKDTVTSASNLCGVCGNGVTYTDHFKPSPNYHEFEGNKAKQSAA